MLTGTLAGPNDVCRQQAAALVLRSLASCAPAPRLQGSIRLLHRVAAPSCWHRLHRQVIHSPQHLRKWLLPPVRVPEVEGAAAAGCCLTVHPEGSDCKDPQLSSWLVSLFELVVGLSLHTARSKVAVQSLTCCCLPSLRPTWPEGVDPAPDQLVQTRPLPCPPLPHAAGLCP